MLLLALVLASRVLPSRAGGQAFVAGQAIYDYAGAADTRVFDRKLAADVINVDLHRAPGTLMEKKNVTAPPPPPHATSCSPAFAP